MMQLEVAGKRYPVAAGETLIGSAPDAAILLVTAKAYAPATRWCSPPRRGRPPSARPSRGRTS